MSYDKSEEIVEIDDVICTHETDMALHVKIDGELHWIPKSQIKGGDIENDGDEGTLSITEWIAIQKELV